MVGPVQTPTADGVLPLNEGARPGKYRVVRGLIYNDADPRARDGNGQQAIELARDPRIRDLIAAWTEH